MAAIVVDDAFELAGLPPHLAARLPRYAHPLFLRISQEMAVTATFKHKKSELAQAGYDPMQTDDPIYFNDGTQGEFVRLDAALFEAIRTGAVRP
jgi:fatty-acyl-CoA synthase